MFGFGSMSPFFHDEYLFNDDEKPRRKRRNDSEDDYCRAICPVCGRKMKFRAEAVKVRCRDCGNKFNVN